MTMRDPTIQKMVARNARLRSERDTSLATKAAQLMREAMAVIETMETNENTAAAVEHLSMAADVLSAWAPKGR